MMYEELVGRLRCPRVTSCPVDSGKMSCRQCQKDIPGQAAHAIEKLQAELEQAKQERDAAVVHGRWIIGEMDVLGAPIHCSECGWGSDCADSNKWMKYPGHRWCGACGAKMDLEEQP